MSTSIVSVQDCIRALQNKFNTTDIQFINLEVKPISENVEGLLGEHYNLFITYEIDKETKTEVLFLKIKPTKSDLQIEMCNAYKAYTKEIFIYDILIKEFNKYGYDTSFAAKYYHCVPDKLLILENLVRKGYELSKMQTAFDLNKLKCALKSVAMFHAAGFAYQGTKTKELGSFDLGKEFAEYFEEIFFVFRINPKHFSMTWWNNSIKTLNKLIDLLPDDETYRSEFKTMFNNFPFGQVFVEKSKFAKTCGHGDLWSNNMLFKYEDDVLVDCRLLDYQICRYFYPSFDVLLSIYNNTNSTIRDAHLNELYEYYYKTLGETLETYGYAVQNILPKEDFYESIRLTKVDALLQVVSLASILYLPTEMVTSIVKENNSDGLKELLQDNAHLCTEAFTKDARYSKILSEALREIRSALLALQ